MMVPAFIGLHVCLALFMLSIFLGPGMLLVFLFFSFLHTLVLFMIALLAHAAARDIFAETETAEAPP